MALQKYIILAELFYQTHVDHARCGHHKPILHVVLASESVLSFVIGCYSPLQNL